jgi:hypothetical protein
MMDDKIAVVVAVVVLGIAAMVVEVMQAGSGKDIFTHGSAGLFGIAVGKGITGGGRQ